MIVGTLPDDRALPVDTEWCIENHIYVQQSRIYDKRLGETDSSHVVFPEPTPCPGTFVYIASESLAATWVIPAVSVKMLGNSAQSFTTASDWEPGYA